MAEDEGRLMEVVQVKVPLPSSPSPSPSSPSPSPLRPAVQARLVQLPRLQVLPQLLVDRRLRQPRRLVRPPPPPLAHADHPHPRPQQHRHRQPGQRRVHAQDQLQQLPQGEGLLLHPRGPPRRRDLQRRRRALELPAQDGQPRARQQLRPLQRLRIVSNEVRTRLSLLDSVSASRGTIDLQDIFRRFSFDTICKISFGLDPACLDLFPMSEFAAAFDLATSLSRDGRPRPRRGGGRRSGCWTGDRRGSCAGRSGWSTCSPGR
ncbi:uncharacterized protein M6B38_251160 [Iris pallida]|uniref:Uncharacterized protein n=1 Tax=Iris pallida TaxID=29817 RepID=A0AAX6IJ55_IRIPA|nr:uncharacterized protein M6B38_251160 [Iris pallida]